jgi:hypothetical protein
MSFDQILNRIHTEPASRLALDKRSNGLDAVEVKKLASYLGLTVGSKSKIQLIELIKQTLDNDEALAAIENAKNHEDEINFDENDRLDIDEILNEEKDKDYEQISKTPTKQLSTHSKYHINTFPRLINILMDNSDKLKVVGLLSTRMGLQMRNYKSNQDIFKIAAESFNDPEYNSGGNLFPNDIHLAAINPEDIQTVMDTNKIYNIFNTIRGKLSKAVANSKKSGTHANEFWNFCDNNTDTYYLYMIINPYGITELKSIAMEKTVFNNGK